MVHFWATCIKLIVLVFRILDGLTLRPRRLEHVAPDYSAGCLYSLRNFVSDASLG